MNAIANRLFGAVVRGKWGRNAATGRWVDRELSETGQERKEFPPGSGTKVNETLDEMAKLEVIVNPESRWKFSEKRLAGPRPQCDGQVHRHI